MSHDGNWRGACASTTRDRSRRWLWRLVGLSGNRCSMPSNLCFSSLHERYEIARREKCTDHLENDLTSIPFGHNESIGIDFANNRINDQWGLARSAEANFCDIS